MFRSIVVAVDGSEPASRALEAACQLAGAFDGEIHLIHVTENRNDPQGTSVMAAAAAQVQTAGITPSSTTVGEGDAFEEIMTIVGLYGADLVVTGRRGLGNISGLFAGSTSQQIAKHAKCAFLSVR
ncbi:universal stress protein [Roseobacter weihaiensis]|uniref:universal stress protein n=1 Tax=Roseobacter weihaiensis TaxID=2763262 RepID=UPI001D0BB9C1|nr:universal stress protein [Roseobacter sp. H9]